MKALLQQNAMSLVAYFRHVPLTLALGVAFVAALYFTWPSEPEPGAQPQAAFSYKAPANTTDQADPTLGDAAAPTLGRSDPQSIQKIAPDSEPIDIVHRPGKDGGLFIPAVIPGKI